MLQLAAANWSVDEKQPWRGYGFSAVLSKDGDVLAAANSLFGSEIVLAELPLGKNRAANFVETQRPRGTILRRCKRRGR